jgi:hypothetical protein
MNISNKPKKIQMKGKLRSILFDKDNIVGFTIEPEFIEVE